MQLSYLPLRSATLAFAVLGISFLVFSKSHSDDSNVEDSSAPSSFNAGDDMTIAMQSRVRVQRLAKKEEGEGTASATAKSSKAFTSTKKDVVEAHEVGETEAVVEDKAERRRRRRRKADDKKVKADDTDDPLGKHDVQADDKKADDKKAPINIEFGGAAHSSTERDKKHGVYLQRPEAVKAKRCDDQHCYGCTDNTKCFHGVEKDNWGWLQLSVPGGEPYKRYVADVWARCESSQGEWWIEGSDSTNGKVSVEINNRIIKDDLGSGSWVQLPIPGSKPKARVSIVFTPDDLNAASGTKVWVEAYQVDQNVDTCMAAKDCLSVFGDHTSDPLLKAAQFEIRNDNVLQKKCLLGWRDQMTEAEKEVCLKWDSCLIKSGKRNQLMAFLGAGIGSGQLLERRLVQAASQSRGVQALESIGPSADPTECIDPTTADPESWDCDCAETMTATCVQAGHGGANLEECLRLAMCREPSVCCLWKESRCPAPWSGCPTTLIEDGERLEGSFIEEAAEADFSKGELLSRRTNRKMGENESRVESLDESLSMKKTC